MKYRVGFVTNSSSTSSIVIMINTNLRTINVSFNMENIYMPEFGDNSLDSYESLCLYLLESIIKEYALNSEYSNLFEISNGYIGDIYFEENEFPENPTEEQEKIKKIVDLYNNIDENFEGISTYDEFMNNENLKFILNLKDNEKIIDIIETLENSGDWGNDPTTKSKINVKNLEISGYTDYSGIIDSYLDSEDYLWLKLEEYVDLNEMISEYINITYSIETIYEIRFFVINIAKLLLKNVVINDGEIKKYNDFLNSFKIFIDEDSIDPYNETTSIHNEDYLTTLFEYMEPIVEKAIIENIDFEDIAEQSMFLTKEYRKDRVNSIVEKYKGGVSFVGIFYDNRHLDNFSYSFESVLSILKKYNLNFVDDLESAKTLILGDKAGKKLERAKSLNMLIIPFNDFLNDIDILERYRKNY